jgi:hypothetical protein
MREQGLPGGDCAGADVPGDDHDGHAGADSAATTAAFPRD